MQACSQELAMLAFEALPQAILIANPQGRIVICNSAAAALLDDGDRLDTILATQDGPLLAWPRLLAELADSAGHIEHKELCVLGRAGRQLVVDVSIYQLGDPAGAVLVSLVDASNRLSLECRLAASQRLAAIGEVAAQVAHDLNNPLDGVCRYIGLAQRTEGATAQQYLDSARQGLERMAAIIRQLLERGDARKAGRKAPLGELLAEAVHAMQPAAQACGVKIVVNGVGENGDRQLFRKQQRREKVPSPHFPDGRLVEVFCNIIRNALDAMSDGGTLTIAHHEQDAAVILNFTDTGCGIAAQDLPRVFDPFYTTKPLGQGSGLGLAICRQIIGQSGGTISAASTGDRAGTTITIQLPCSIAAAARPDEAKP